MTRFGLSDGLESGTMTLCEVSTRVEGARSRVAGAGNIFEASQLESISHIEVAALLQDALVLGCAAGQASQPPLQMVGVAGYSSPNGGGGGGSALTHSALSEGDELVDTCINLSVNSIEWGLDT